MVLYKWRKNKWFFKKPQKDDDVDANDDEDESDDEDDEEEEIENVERDFKFEDFAKRLLNQRIIRACTMALVDWETMPTKSLKAAVTILYRVAFELKCPAMLYHAKLFTIFQKVFGSPRNKHSEELRKLGIYVVRQFVEMAPKNPKIFAEMLFYKTLKEANDLENGYSDTYQGSTKGAWTEEQEDELRMLFEENQRNPQTDQDVIDWILDNLIDKTRTRRGVMKKLKEMDLMFKAPTKKSSAAAAQKNLWQHEEDELLKSLYDEHRLENDCLARMMEALGEKRSKNNIIKRMIQLHLIADRSEIIPEKVKKPRAKKRQQNTSDTEQSDVESEGKQTKRKSKSKPKIRKASKKSKTSVKSPLDVGTVKFLIAQIDDKFKDALDWLKEGLKDAADDFEEVSDDNDDGVPLLPLQEVEKEAVENETFTKLLLALGVQPPVEGIDQYWKIPVYLNAADLRMRVQVLDGTYNPEFGENVSIIEDGTESEASEDNDAAGSSSDPDDNDGSDDDDDASGSREHFLNKRREHFDNLVFNQSDNEDEHRAPLKQNKRQKGAKANQASADDNKSKGRVRRSKKIDINEMLMEEGSEKDEENDATGNDDSIFENLDSENLRRRLKELVDDDDIDNDANTEGTTNNSSSEKGRRIRRKVIDSDSSDDEMNVQLNVSLEKDAPSSSSSSSTAVNGSNKIDKDHDESRKQQADVNNQSANSSGELADFPSNSLRMSPTPDDEDYVQSANIDNNKRSRNDINAASDSDGSDELGVQKKKKKKVSEQDSENRRWTSIVDDDSE